MMTNISRQKVVSLPYVALIFVVVAIDLVF